ncbi:hypothetical protein CIC12_24285 [Burkholderia sp. SG-MS1]|nr:hypothetical protein [Paraburkholderia sp. SG-MS1]
MVAFEEKPAARRGCNASGRAALSGYCVAGARRESASAAVTAKTQAAGTCKGVSSANSTAPIQTNDANAKARARPRFTLTERAVRQARPRSNHIHRLATRRGG